MQIYPLIIQLNNLLFFKLFYFLFILVKLTILLKLKNA